MTALLELFVRTLLMGVAVAAPVGAMGVLCIHRTPDGGFRRGAATGAGVATADALYASLAAFGIGSVTAQIAGVQAPLRIVGGGLLVALGALTAFRRALRADSDTSGFVEVRSDYASAFGLTLTNPMTIISFAAVLASAGFASDGFLEGLVAVLGVGLGSIVWWLALSAFISRMRRALPPHALRRVNAASGALLISFGLATVGSALW